MSTMQTVTRMVLTRAVPEPPRPVAADSRRRFANLKSTVGTLPLFRRTGAKLFLSFFYGGSVVC